MSVATADEVSGPIAGVSQGWKHALPALMVLMIGVSLCYRGTLSGMVEIWLRSETFTHCFLIAPISIWLVWRRKEVLARLRPAPSPTVLIAITLGGVAWLLGQLGATNALTQFAVVAFYVLAVPAVLGYRVAATIAFPLAFLFFSVPFGEFVMPQMMETTADFTVLALRLSGIPVYREGLQFVIPSGSWSVVEACSGVRYLIASFTVGTLFAYLNYRSMRRRVIFMVVSLVVPVIANWLRAYMIVMLGHLSSNRLAVGVDHLIYGWIFFGVVIMIMFAIGARWSEEEFEQPLDAERFAAKPARNAGVPVPYYVVASLAAMILLVPPIIESHIAAAETTAPVALTGTIAPQGWSSGGPLLSDLRPEFENPAAERHLAYRKGEDAVGLYVAYFRHQGPGRKMISSESVLVSSGNRQWAQVSGRMRDVALERTTLSFKVAELLGAGLRGGAGEGRWLVWQVYWIDDHWTSSAAMAKALTVWSRLCGRGDDSAVVLMYTRRIAGDPSAQLERFAAAAMPAIGAALAQTRDAR